MTVSNRLGSVVWRKSSFSGAGECFDVALLPDGRIAVRNRHALRQGILEFPRKVFRAFVLGIKAGEFDDLI